MLTSKLLSSSSSKVAGAFAADTAARVLPVAGFAQVPAAIFPTLVGLSRLELLAYLFLVLRCDGWTKRGKEPPRVRAEEIADVLGVTRRRVLLAIATLVDKRLVRRLTPLQAHGGCRYEIASPSVIENDHSAQKPHGNPRITEAARSVIPPLPSEGLHTSYVPDRSEQTQTSSLQLPSGSFPPDPRAGARGEGRNEKNGTGQGAELAAAVELLLERSDIRSPNLARRELHRLSNVLHGKHELLIVAAEQYCAKQGPWASSAPLYYGIAWIVDNAATWVRSVEKTRQPKPDREADSTVTVCMLSPAQLAAQERARQKLLATRSMPAWMVGPARGGTASAKVIPARTSPEQSGVLGVTLGAAEGGRR